MSTNRLFIYLFGARVDANTILPWVCAYICMVFVTINPLSLLPFLDLLV